MYKLIRAQYDALPSGDATSAMHLLTDMPRSHCDTRVRYIQTSVQPRACQRQYASSAADPQTMTPGNSIIETNSSA